MHLVTENGIVIVSMDPMQALLLKQLASRRVRYVA